MNRPQTGCRKKVAQTNLGDQTLNGTTNFFFFLYICFTVQEAIFSLCCSFTFQGTFGDIMQVQVVGIFAQRPEMLLASSWCPGQPSPQIEPVHSDRSTVVDKLPSVINKNQWQYSLFTARQFLDFLFHMPIVFLLHCLELCTHNCGIHSTRPGFVFFSPKGFDNCSRGMLSKTPESLEILMGWVTPRDPV